MQEPSSNIGKKEDLNKSSPRYESMRSHDKPNINDSVYNSKLSSAHKPASYSAKRKKGTKTYSLNKIEPGLKHSVIAKECPKSQRAMNTHLKSSKVLKKPYDRLGKDYANYLTNSARYSNIPVKKADLNQPLSRNEDGHREKQVSCNSSLKSNEKMGNTKQPPHTRNKKSKKSLMGCSQNSKEMLLQASHLQMLRNLSPVVDRKVMVDLRSSSSFKAPEKAGKTKGHKKGQLKSPRDYLSKNNQK